MNQPTSDHETVLPPSPLRPVPYANSITVASGSSLPDAARTALASIELESTSDNTARSYTAALRYFSAWHSLRYGVPPTFPLHEETVLLYVADHWMAPTGRGKYQTAMPPVVLKALHEGGFTSKAEAPKVSTLMHRLAVLSKHHQALAARGASAQVHYNPFDQPVIKSKIAQIRRAHASRNIAPETSDPLQAADLLEVVEHIKAHDDSIRGLRDVAILFFAFASGGRRRSEVADADMSRLTRHRSGDYTYNLHRSKNNQAGLEHESNKKPITGVAALALSAWLQAAQIRSGRIFRGVLPNGRLTDSLSGKGVRDIVYRRCLESGLAGKYSAKSLRSGFVTESVARNIPLLEAMAMTGHRTTKAFTAYHKHGSLRSSPVSTLLDTTMASPKKPS